MANTAGRRKTKKMKWLLYVTILGFIIWIITEIIEFTVGYNRPDYYLTSAFHVLGAFGIWGLHLAQSRRRRNIVSLVGTTLISISFVSIIYFPIQVMHSGLTYPEAFLEHHRVYTIPLAGFAIGFIIFSIAVLRTKYFPNWTGWVVILGAIIMTGIYTYESVGDATSKTLHRVLNINDIIFSIAIIYMCLFGLRRRNNTTTANKWP
jgi:peptidoglycan/LPS O-acetylase OafA/YrhL